LKVGQSVTKGATQGCRLLLLLLFLLLLLLPTGRGKSFHDWLRPS